MNNFETLSRIEQHTFPGARSRYAELPQIPQSDVIWMTSKDADGDWINGVFAKGSNDTCVLHFYGNHESLRSSQYMIDRLRNQGNSVLMFDYRGYGASEGKPREAAFYSDAELAYDWLLERYPDKKVVVSGWFVGSAVAIHLAQVRPVEAAILFAAPTNMIDVVSHIFPKDEIIIEEGMPFRFDNLERIRKLRCPILMVHGVDDPVVPYTMSTRLEAAVRSPLSRIDVPYAGHQDLFVKGGEKLWHLIEEFLDGVLRTEKQAKTATKDGVSNFL